jgi:septal ring factor EnvC (AmiA/AmiB activator)
VHGAANGGYTSCSAIVLQDAQIYTLGPVGPDWLLRGDDSSKQLNAMTSEISFWRNKLEQSSQERDGDRNKIEALHKEKDSLKKRLADMAS